MLTHFVCFKHEIRNTAFFQLFLSRHLIYLRSYHSYLKHVIEKNTCLTERDIYVSDLLLQTALTKSMLSPFKPHPTHTQIILEPPAVGFYYGHRSWYFSVLFWFRESVLWCHNSKRFDKRFAIAKWDLVGFFFVLVFGCLDLINWRKLRFD